MSTPFILLLLSIAGAIWSVFAADGVLSDLTLLAGLSAVASMILMVMPPRGVRPVPRREVRAKTPRPPRQRGISLPSLPRRPVQAAPEFDASDVVLIDGSNVLYWQGGEPTIEAVRLVLRAVEERGLRPLVGFDANIGYLVAGRFLGAGDLAALLDLPPYQVSVAPKGKPADPLLLGEAARLDARVITNDRYRDWARKFPQVARPGFLVRGCIRGSTADLDFAAAA